MTTHSKFDKSVDFVARHWREDAFLADQAIEKLGLSKRPRRVWRRVAAAAAGVVVLGASAALYFTLTNTAPAPEPAPVATEASVQTVSPLERSERIEFTDAPLAEVVKKIEQTYGVRIKNVPAGDFRLTLSYEGTAPDLVATINELLEIKLTVTE